MQVAHDDTHGPVAPAILPQVSVPEATIAELLEFCWQIGAYVDAAQRLMAETQIDNTVERLLEEAGRQLDLMRQKIEDSGEEADHA